MKKLSVILISTLLFFLLLFSACSFGSPNPKEPDGGSDQIDDPISPEVLTIADYFPFQPNVLMDYEGIGMEFAEEITYVDYVHGDTLQLRSINLGTTMAKVYKLDAGELKLVFGREDYYYLEDFSTLEDNRSEILLKEPLSTGNFWLLSGGESRSITDTAAEIETPAGSFTALEVTTQATEYTLRHYYVRDVGLVLKEFESGDAVIKTTLKKLSTDTSNSFPVRFYYPDFDKNKLAGASKVFEYNTNGDILAFFEENFKNPPAANLSRVISPNVKINQLTIDLDNHMAVIDLSGNYVSEMNAGSSLESLIIQGLTNTLGGYYGLQKVFVTLDGKPYESGHFMLDDKTWFEPDFENVYELE